MSRQVTVRTTVAGEEVEAGTATFSEGRLFTCSFRYAIDYLAHPHAYELEPGLTLDEGAHTFDGRLPLAFDDASPDLWGRRLLEDQRAVDRRAAPGLPAGLSPADYLLGVSDETRQGALRFIDAVQPSRQVPSSLTLAELLAAADSVLAEDETWADALKTLLDAGTGALGGALPKAAVKDDQGALWIAKFPMLGDRYHRPVWEKTALDLAERCGVEVPVRRLEWIGDRPVLLVRRFDRDDAGRVPYISARTLIQDTSQTESADYVDVAQALRAEGTRPRDDVVDLFRRVVVGALMNDTDNHLRNMGFLRDRGGWTLAPAFDLNPNRDVGAVRATAAAGSRTLLDLAHGLAELSRHCSVRPAEARSIVGDTLSGLSVWRDVAEENGASGRELDRFDEAFSVASSTDLSDLGRSV